MKTINDISTVLKQKNHAPKNRHEYNRLSNSAEWTPLFVDKLIKYKNKDSNVSNIGTVFIFEGKPHYVCFIKDNTVAPGSYKILLIDLVSREMIKNIVPGNVAFCYGIDSNGKVIVVA